MTRRTATARLSSLAGVVVLIGLAYVGSRLLAQQPAPQVLTPESLSIPEQPPPAPPSAMLQNYPAVTAERLKQPADGEWLMCAARTTDGVTVLSINQHEERRCASSGMDSVSWHEQRTRGCADRQRRRDVRLDVVQPGAGARRKVGHCPMAVSQSRADKRARQTGERGVSLYGDKVFTVLTEAVLVALDAKTEKEVWRTIVGNTRSRVHDSAAAGRRRQACHGYFWRRRREPRICGCLRSWNGPRALENVHDAVSRRAGSETCAATTGKPAARQRG